MECTPESGRRRSVYTLRVEHQICDEKLNQKSVTQSFYIAAEHTVKWGGFFLLLLAYGIPYQQSLFLLRMFKELFLHEHKQKRRNADK
jgi:hypothetical protein